MTERGLREQGKWEDPPWEPVEWKNEMDESRWQPRSEREKLWKSGVRVVRGEWMSESSYKGPKLYRNRLRALGKGKRRYKKNSTKRWTRVKTTERRPEYQDMWAKMQAAVPPDSEPEPQPSGWVTRQSDHGEEVWDDVSEDEFGTITPGSQHG